MIFLLEKKKGDSKVLIKFICTFGISKKLRMPEVQHR